MVIEANGGAAEKPVVAEPYDPASVPLMKWSDYEAAHRDLDDTQTVTSYQTGLSKSQYSEIQSKKLQNRQSYLSHAIFSPGVVPGAVAAVANRFPTDEEILNEVRHILSTTDLMKVTKKSVRDQLGRLFGVDLSSKKEYIHSCIDGILKGEL